MSNIFNADFRDFLTALRQKQVRYVLVGDYSVILHGYSRTTGDLNIWVDRTPANYERLVQAFRVFGIPVFGMSAGNFLGRPDLDVFTFGRPPVAIDIIPQLKGLDFAEAYAQAPEVEVDGLTVRLLHLQDLRRSKRAAGRPRDQNDLDNLPERA